jgi:hypothetical protein
VANLIILFLKMAKQNPLKITPKKNSEKRKTKQTNSQKNKSYFSFSESKN